MSVKATGASPRLQIVTQACNIGVAPQVADAHWTIVYGGADYEPGLDLLPLLRSEDDLCLVVQYGREPAAGAKVDQSSIDGNPMVLEAVCQPTIGMSRSSRPRRATPRAARPSRRGP
jgi:hypothetical protein